MHALIGAICQGHKDVVSAIIHKKNFNVSLFNNAALKWALAKKNKEAVDLITAHPSFSFGTHAGILMAAIKANNVNAAKLALQCPTLNYTHEYLYDCFKKALKSEALDVIPVLFEDHRFQIQTNELRLILERDFPAEYKNKFFAAMLNNPSFAPRSGHLIDVGLHEEATDEMRRMAFFQDPDNIDNCIAGKLAKRDDFTLFKINCGSDGFTAMGEAIQAKKYEWVRYMHEHNKIPAEAYNDFDPNEDPELTKILKPDEKDLI